MARQIGLLSQYPLHLLDKHGRWESLRLVCTQCGSKNTAATADPETLLMDRHGSAKPKPYDVIICRMEVIFLTLETHATLPEMS
jgi:hypothetical protein